MKHLLSIATCLWLPCASAQISSVATPFESIPDNETVVWSALFQATWDALNVELGGKPTALAGPNELMSHLDNFKWSAQEVMPSGHWKTWHGPSTQDFLDQVNAEAARMTGENQGPFHLKNPDPACIACFGLLNHQVEFPKPFSKGGTRTLSYGATQTPVRFFGTRSHAAEDYRAHVRVLAYRPIDGSHALEITCKNADDRLILYRPAKAQDFATACKWVNHWRATHDQQAGEYGRWHDGFLHKGDEIKIPLVVLEVTTDFAPQLDTGRIHPKPGSPWHINRAEQKTKFELDEKGARVRVEVSIEADPLGGPPPPPPPYPRKFIYDQPFFVFMWREKADWPYFGAWIGNDASLVKASPKPTP